MAFLALETHRHLMLLYACATLAVPQSSSRSTRQVCLFFPLAGILL